MTVETPGTVDFRLQPSNRPATEAEMRALRELWEKEIDYDDNPPQPGSGWWPVSELVPAENKKQITLRLDADVIQFFRGTGRRYQSRMNAVLREYMTEQRQGV
jgi:uncharacterized protein (DUF4415 family)